MSQPQDYATNSIDEKKITHLGVCESEIISSKHIFEYDGIEFTVTDYIDGLDIKLPKELKHLECDLDEVLSDMWCDEFMVKPIEAREDDFLSWLKTAKTQDYLALKKEYENQPRRQE